MDLYKVYVEVSGHFELIVEADSPETAADKAQEDAKGMLPRELKGASAMAHDGVLHAPATSV